MLYTREKLGELLVKAGVITEEQLAEALNAKAHESGKIGELLRRRLLVTEEQLAETLASQKGLERVDLRSVSVDRAAAATIPEQLARRHGMVPIAFRGEDLVVALEDPLDVEAMADVEMRTGRRVLPVVATGSQIRHAIDKHLGSAHPYPQVRRKGSERRREDRGPEPPVVRLVDRLIREAVVQGASDIHIEPMEESVRVRYRVDGMLHHVMDLPLSLRDTVLSRVKVLAEMDIAERRRPQDGRVSITRGGLKVDLRLASLPTSFGESLAIRILAGDRTLMSLDDIGMSEESLEQFRSLLCVPQGAILVAGPTGSGKSTTMYAGLRELNEPHRKIISIEDPVEYRIQGVTQIAVNNRTGLTFAAGLRSVLRSDPDTVVVGEVRDGETAAIAVRAALTGHLVLTSIHTSDAPSALIQLADMGVAPYVTSCGLLAVVAQRLARRLCLHCRREVSVPTAALRRGGFEEHEIERLHLYGPAGCDACLGTGYRGRVGLFEIMRLDDDLRRMFLEGASSSELRDVALRNGMKSLRRDALDKVAAGITSLEEIERVVT